MKGNNKRCCWIDIAKGIGIILVIYGHISFRPEWLNVWLCSFHMPLFFFLSGLTFNINKYKKFYIFAKTKFKQLIIPYFLFAFAQWIWTGIEELFKIIGGEQNLDVMYLCKQFVGIVVQIRTTVFGPGVWFIPCIFCSFLIVYFIWKVGSGSKIKAACLAVSCVVIGYCYCTFVNIKLPWGLDAAFVEYSCAMKSHFRKSGVLPQLSVFHFVYQPDMVYLMP